MSANFSQYALVTIAVIAAPAFGDVNARLEKAKEHINASNYDAAISELNEVIRLDPKNAAAYFYRGRAHQLSPNANTNKAIADFSEVLRLDPKYREAYMQRGTCLLFGDKPAQAVTDLTEAIRLDAKYYEAFFYRGKAYYQCAEYGKAIQDYERAIRLEPRESVAYLDLARTLAVCPEAKFRDGGKAVEYATKACNLTDWKVHMALEALAAAHAELGQFDEAIKWQKKAVEMFPFESPKRRLKLFEDHKPLRYRSIADW
jgi:tetratricopeptide (TPR) repeat protein